MYIPLPYRFLTASLTDVMFLFILSGSLRYSVYSCSGEYFGTYLPIGDWIFLDLIGLDWIEFGVDLSLIGFKDDWILFGV